VLAHDQRLPVGPLAHQPHRDPVTLRKFVIPKRLGGDPLLALIGVCSEERVDANETISLQDQVWTFICCAGGLIQTAVALARYSASLPHPL
jgi:hypothetical protein